MAVELKLNDLVRELELRVVSGRKHLDREITGGYVSDLLSDVMAHARPGNIWITLQGHQNIVAVAVLRRLAGIILINNRQPDEGTLGKAEAENIPVFVSSLPAFELAGRMYRLGISGQS